MLAVTADFVIGYLKRGATSDPVVLASRKHELVQMQQPMKLVSLCFIVVGVVLSITIIGAIVGIPMLCIAGWVQARARGNIRTIEAAYLDYLSRNVVQVAT